MQRLLMRLLLGRWLPKPPVTLPDDTLDQPDPSDGVRSINRQRQLHGLRPLIAMTCLSVQAYGHSEQMQRRGRLSHDGFTLRLAACEFQAGSENVAWGQRDWSEACADWMTSSGHRRNMLGDWDFLGVGRSGVYYTAIFARR